MKRSVIATLLNFLVPGAGLWYLGRRAWAAVNLCVATAIVLLAPVLAPDWFDEQMHYVIFAVAAGSAGLAHALARGGRPGRQSEQAPPLHAAASPLAKAFMEDHRQLTQHLSRLLESLKEEQTAAAVELADELDRVAGPHIRFEEEFFYPLVAKTRGQEFASRLYEEHRIGRDAVSELRHHDPSESLTPAARKSLLEGVQTAFDHTLSCGSLLSYMTTLSRSAQDDLLARLQELRRQPMRWSELPAHGKEAGPVTTESTR